jgi:hypothetical protein
MLTFISVLSGKTHLPRRHEDTKKTEQAINHREHREHREILGDAECAKTEHLLLFLNL